MSSFWFQHVVIAIIYFFNLLRYYRCYPDVANIFRIPIVSNHPQHHHPISELVHWNHSITTFHDSYVDLESNGKLTRVLLVDNGSHIDKMPFPDLFSILVLRPDITFLDGFCFFAESFVFEPFQSIPKYPWIFPDDRSHQLVSDG